MTDQRLVGVLCLTLLCAHTSVATPAALGASEVAHFMPGEVVVMFAPDSKEQAQVAQAAQQPTPDLTGLGVLAQGLGTAAHVPLRLQRLGSGGVVVLAIDSEAVVERVASALRQTPRFADAQVEVKKEVASGGRPTEPQVRIVSAANERDPSVDEQIATVQDKVGVPLTWTVAGDRDIRVQVDWSTLTTDVVERVKKQPNVVHAEANYFAAPLEPQRQR